MPMRANRIITGTVACLAMLIVLLPDTLSAASVTLANGDVLEGTILGRILVDRPARDANGNKTSPTFRLIEGKDISSIDATGIHMDGESIVLMGMKGATPADVLQGLVWWDEGRALKLNQGLVRDVGKAQVVGARLPSSKIGPASEELMGEVAVNHARKTVEFTGSIRLQRPDGQITIIGIPDITKFTQSR